jgi:hypothetical protein
MDQQVVDGLVDMLVQRKVLQVAVWMDSKMVETKGLSMVVMKE